MAELYTRLENLKSKQTEGVKTTRYTTDAVRDTRKRIRELLSEADGLEETQIPIDDARTLVEYFSGIRYLPEFKKTRKRQQGSSKPCKSSSGSPSPSRHCPLIIIQEIKEIGKNVNFQQIKSDKIIYYAVINFFI